MNICIIGAGNIGTYLAAYISMKHENKEIGRASCRERV